MTPELDPLHVAIDGPAGSGKSSVAAAVAERLGLAHVDTGAMYRALTRAALDEGIDPSDGERLAARLEALGLRFESGRLLVDDADPGDALRTQEVDGLVSQVSAHAAVREAMQRRQRQASWDHSQGVVMEGRDIGTHVLPLARAKVYLDAAVEVRATRRARQAGRPTEGMSFGNEVEELARRDHLDSTREESPLRIAPDAFVLATDDLGFEQVVDQVAAFAEAQRPQRVAKTELSAYRWRQRSYWGSKNFLETLLSIPYRMRVFGRAHQEIRQPLVFACNHCSYWDPVLLGTKIDRQVSFIAKRELFKGPLGWLLRFYGTIPIVRGRFDREAFATAGRVLADGGNVVIFPEGTRKPVGKPGPVKRGLGILVMATDAPYLPCFVRGTTRSGHALRGVGDAMELWLGPPTVLRGLDALRRQGFDDSALQARIGELYLAQIRALSHRAEHFG